MLKKLFATESVDPVLSLGLLILRAGVGGPIFFAHGMAKARQIDLFTDFVSRHVISTGASVLGWAMVGAEIVCSALVIAGLATRLAVLPLIGVMLLALCVIHLHGNWSASKELSLVYLVVLLALLCTGAGRYSLDALLCRRREADAVEPASANNEVNS
ncbi:MAG: DoxX family protein [Verrucomicrobiales bacterium]